MAQDLSTRLSRVKFYDHIVKLQNFQCPEDKQISEGTPSDLQEQLKFCLNDLKFKVV